MKKTKLKQLNLKKLTVSVLTNGVKGGKVNLQEESVNVCFRYTERSTCADSRRVCLA
ncbi:hypothetical protein ACJD0Z_00765 [Flavobacteriaceae bacterium M23B6Z8]